MAIDQDAFVKSHALKSNKWSIDSLRSLERSNNFFELRVNGMKLEAKCVITHTIKDMEKIESFSWYQVSSLSPLFSQC